MRILLTLITVTISFVLPPLLRASSTTYPAPGEPLTQFSTTVNTQVSATGCQNPVSDTSYSTSSTAGYYIPLPLGGEPGGTGALGGLPQFLADSTPFPTVTLPAPLGTILTLVNGVSEYQGAITPLIQALQFSNPTGTQTRTYTLSVSGSVVKETLVSVYAYAGTDNSGYDQGNSTYNLASSYDISTGTQTFSMSWNLISTNSDNPNGPGCVTVQTAQQSGSGMASYYAGSPITIVSALPSDVENVPYGIVATVSGGVSPTVKITGLPTGLTADANGNISGTPAVGTAANSPYNVVINASDTKGDTAGPVTLPLEVLPNPDLAITTTALPPAKVGVGYEFCLQHTGGTGVLTWKSSPEPIAPGIDQVLPLSGCLDDIPIQPGSFPFSVTISDQTGNTSPAVSLVLQVSPTTPTKTSYARLAAAELNLCLDGLGPIKSTSRSDIGEATGEVVTCSLASLYAKWAADPPDPNYKTVPSVTPLPFSLPNTGWPANVNLKYQRLLENQADVYGYEEAALEDTEKADGAEAAGDSYWESIQSQAAAENEEIAIRKMTEFGYLVKQLETSYTNAGLNPIIITPTDSNAVIAALPNLPPAFENGLLGAGLSSTDIASLVNLLEGEPPPTSNISLFDLLNENAALQLAEAPNLSPLATLRSAAVAAKLDPKLESAFSITISVVEEALSRGDFRTACATLGIMRRDVKALERSNNNLAPIVAAIDSLIPICPGCWQNGS